MPLTVLNPALDQGRTTFREYSYVDRPQVATWRRKAAGRFTGVALHDFVLRAWRWELGFNEADRASWQAFLLALGWIRAPFLLRDPRDPIRTTTLEPAVGDGVRVTFSLPTVESHADYLFFPQNDLAVTSGLVGGGPVTISAVGTDARTATFAVAPGAAAVELIYQPLRLVRLVVPPEISSSHQVFSRTTCELEQLSRD